MAEKEREPCQSPWICISYARCQSCSVIDSEKGLWSRYHDGGNGDCGERRLEFNPITGTVQFRSIRHLGQIFKKFEPPIIDRARNPGLNLIF
jgi:hypothetical protein